jgi:hypothetical protein
LDVAAWQFFVVLTEQIETELATQNSVGIKRIQAISDPILFSDLKLRIDTVFGFMQ